VWLTGGAEEAGARGSGEVRPAGRSRVGCAAASVSSYGRRRGDAQGVASSSSSLGFCSSSSLSPWCGDSGKEKGARVARASGGGLGVFMGRP
jgi:hypothetical protein